MASSPSTDPLARYEPVIGLEVHCQLLTASKMFCGCPNRFGGEANTRVCPVCLGLPGSLPVLNRNAVSLALRACLATGCTIHETSIFARKNYFYPDLPKGYQISQYELPLATNGRVEIASGGPAVGVRLHRIHLEEDAGKLLHEGFSWSSEKSGVDFNRSGVPLIEIVSAPDMRTSSEAHAYLEALKALLLYCGVSDCNMEEGSLRCDANVSVRPRGQQELGTRAEIKNLNSFRNVARAIDHEVARQVMILEGGGRVTQETRLFNADRGETQPMRSKEEAHDYRYFPEPDLPALVVSGEWIEKERGALPELPPDRRRRFVKEYQIPEYDASVLILDRGIADYYEAVAGESRNPKAASNWVMSEVLRKLKEGGESGRIPVTPAHLGELIGLVETGAVNMRTAKEVFETMWSSGGSPGAIVSREGLGQVSDEAVLQQAIADVLAASPEQVGAYRKGKTQTLGWFVGQVMKRTGGKANPQVVNGLLKKALEG